MNKVTANVFCKTISSPLPNSKEKKRWLAIAMELLKNPNIVTVPAITL